MKKNPQLPAANCSRGAPMGRPECTDGLDEPARCFYLRFEDAVYDEGGAYWGMPANVYCAKNDAGLQLFVRADNRRKAKQHFKERYPQLKWVN